MRLKITVKFVLSPIYKNKLRKIINNGGDRYGTERI